MARLNVKKVVKLIRRKEIGLSSKLIAKQLGITKRRVNQVWKLYKTNNSFKLGKAGKFLRMLNNE